MERTNEGTWQWWPQGYRCELADGSPAPEQQAATVGGTLLAVLEALVALTLAWLFRSGTWALALGVGAASLAVCGVLTTSVGAVLARLGALQVGFGLGAIAYFRLEPERGTEQGVRVWANVTMAGAASIVTAVYFVLFDSTALGLVRGLLAAALAGTVTEWLTGRPQRASWRVGPQ